MTDLIRRSKVQHRAEQMEESALTNMIAHAGDDAAYRYAIQATERKMFKGCVDAQEDTGEELIKAIEARRDMTKIRSMFNCGMIAAYDEVINLIRDL